MRISMIRVYATLALLALPIAAATPRTGVFTITASKCWAMGAEVSPGVTPMGVVATWCFLNGEPIALVFQ